MYTAMYTGVYIRMCKLCMIYKMITIRLFYVNLSAFLSVNKLHCYKCDPRAGAEGLPSNIYQLRTPTVLTQ